MGECSGDSQLPGGGCSSEDSDSGSGGGAIDGGSDDSQLPRGGCGGGGKDGDDGSGGVASMRGKADRWRRWGRHQLLGSGSGRGQ